MAGEHGSKLLRESTRDSFRSASSIIRMPTTHSLSTNTNRHDSCWVARASGRQPTAVENGHKSVRCLRQMEATSQRSLLHHRNEKQFMPPLRMVASGQPLTAAEPSG